MRSMMRGAFTVSVEVLRDLDVLRVLDQHNARTAGDPSVHAPPGLGRRWRGGGSRSLAATDFRICVAALGLGV